MECISDRQLELLEYIENCDPDNVVNIVFENGDPVLITINESVPEEGLFMGGK